MGSSPSSYTHMPTDIHCPCYSDFLFLSLVVVVVVVVVGGSQLETRIETSESLDPFVLSFI